jgi:hypothetical protein
MSEIKYYMDMTPNAEIVACLILNLPQRVSEFLTEAPMPGRGFYFIQ